LNGVVCLLAAMIVSVNAPQLELFTGRIGEREYLRRTLATYPALERLGEEWKPGDWTLAVKVTSAAYAPDPSRFVCEDLADPDTALPFIRALLTERRYAFLITPASPRGEAIATGLEPELRPERIFRGARFELYRLHGSGPP
jgi:hypothetical protein